MKLNLKNNNRRWNLNVARNGINYGGVVGIVAVFRNKSEKIFKECKKMKFVRGYHTNMLNFGKDEFKVVSKMLDFKIIDYLKVNIKNNLNFFERKVLDHLGVVIDSKFISSEKKIHKGVVAITTIKSYNVKMYDKSNKLIKSIAIGGSNNVFSEVILIEEEKIYKLKLEKNVDNSEFLNLKIKDKALNIVNNMFVNKKSTMHELIVRYPFNKDICKVSKWEKVNDKQGDVILKEIKEEILLKSNKILD